MARSRMPSRSVGSGASKMACTSSRVRCLTKRDSAFLAGIARTRRICSMADGARYSYKMHEGFDCGQSGISRTGPIAACSFQVVQELEHQRCVDLLQCQLGWRHVEALAGEGQKQLERIRIGVPCALASMKFDGQALLEEGGDMWCQGDHDWPPMTKRSVRSAMSRISSGTASRYQ